MKEGKAKAKPVSLAAALYTSEHISDVHVTLLYSPWSATSGAITIGDTEPLRRTPPHERGLAGIRTISSPKCSDWVVLRGGDCPCNSDGCPERLCVENGRGRDDEHRRG